MVDEPEHPAPGISRRRLLTTSAVSAALGAGLGGGAALVWSHPSAPALWYQPGRNGAPPVTGLHLQFGRHAGTEVVVSWHTVDAIRNPRVMYGTPTSGLGRTVAAETRTYRDAKSNTEVRVNHARLTNLTPDTDYVYAAVHDGAEPEMGTIRTAPSGRKPFRFTSFGDQSTPTLERMPDGTYGTDNIGSPASADTTLAVERMAPLFNLVNGDLCYANLAQDRIRTWSAWFENNTRSARYRPWMPAAGNHENELGNGPIGYGAYQAYFTVPDSGSSPETRGLWYSFTAGSVRVISLNNDDVAFQDGGNFYVHGYSGGEQRRWLAAELAAARRDPDVDWIVVCMHQTAISTADQANGADLGIREEWLPLFDQYQVDLVVCGHEHHYERSHPLRGTLQTDTRTPIPVDTRNDVIDSTQGNGARRHRWRRHVRAHQRVLLPPAALPGLDRCRRVRPRARAQGPHLRHGGRAVVRLPRPGQSLRLRGVRRGPGPTRRQHLDQGHALRAEGAVRRGHRGGPVHADQAPRRQGGLAQNSVA